MRLDGRGAGRHPALPATKRAPRTAAFAPADVAAADRPLLDRLKEWRRDKARERGVPAYVIFGDRTLAELAREKPTSLPQLEGIFGIGERKREDLGPDLVEAIRGWMD